MSIHRGSRFLIVAATVVSALLTAVPAHAAPYEEGGTDGEAEAADTLSEVRVRSFTAIPTTTVGSGSSRLSWSVEAPAGVGLRLDGVAIPKTGSMLIRPTSRDERVVLSAHTGGVSGILRQITIGVDPCPQGSATVTSNPQCDRAGTARFTHEMPMRLDANLWNDSNDPNARSNQNRILDPLSWTIVLDACATDPGQHGRIEFYDWKLTQPAPDGTTWTKTVSTDWCRLETGVPRLGDYSVSLVERSAHATKLTRSATIKVRDLLVVSLGDSMASGEGNPDEEGDYMPYFMFDAQWKNAGCHRSAKGGHPRAARRIEAASTATSVSFVSLACTGAETKHLIDVRQDDVNGNERKPQLQAIKDLLCRDGYDCKRPIDLLELSIGMNDVRFSRILKLCLLRNPNGDDTADCDEALKYAERIARDDMVSYLSKIRVHITELGLNVRRVVINEYPINIFTTPQGEPRQGCGALGITERTSRRMLEIGTILNDRLAFFAANAAGWSYAGGIVSAFRGHGYCEEDASWFRGLSASIDKQGDEMGTAHPTGTGHSAIGASIATKYLDGYSTSSWTAPGDAPSPGPVMER